MVARAVSVLYENSYLKIAPEFKEPEQCSCAFM